jgi:hypothetical protein
MNLNDLAANEVENKVGFHDQNPISHILELFITWYMPKEWVS